MSGYEEIMEYLESLTGRSPYQIKNVIPKEVMEIEDEMRNGLDMRLAAYKVLGTANPLYPTPMTIRRGFLCGNKVVCDKVEWDIEIPNATVEFLMKQTVRFCEGGAADLVYIISDLMKTIRQTKNGDSSIICVGVREFGVDSTYEVMHRIAFNVNELGLIEFKNEYRKLYAIRCFGYGDFVEVEVRDIMRSCKYYDEDDDFEYDYGEYGWDLKKV